MISYYSDLSTTQLVGNMVLNNTPEFICLTLSVEGQPLLDRPNSFQFKLSLAEMQVTPIDIHFQVGTLNFSGAYDGQRFFGNVRKPSSNSDAGTFSYTPPCITSHRSTTRLSWGITSSPLTGRSA